MDGSLPGSSVHGILQVRMLEWVAILFSRGSSWPMDWNPISYIVGGFFTNEPLGEAFKYRILTYVCVCVCVCNLEQWYWWIHFQGSNEDADIEKRLVDTVEEGEDEMNRESSMETYTLPYVK